MPVDHHGDFPNLLDELERELQTQQTNAALTTYARLQQSLQEHREWKARNEQRIAAAEKRVIDYLHADNSHVTIYHKGLAHRDELIAKRDADPRLASWYNAQLRESDKRRAKFINEKAPEVIQSVHRQLNTIAEARYLVKVEIESKIHGIENQLHQLETTAPALLVTLT